MFRKISIALVAAAALGSAALAPTSASAWGRGGGSAGSMADFMRDGAIGVSAIATAVGRAGVISIRTAASGLSDRRQYRDDARPHGGAAFRYSPAGRRAQRPLLTAVERSRWDVHRWPVRRARIRPAPPGCGSTHRRNTPTPSHGGPWR
jgi:hypothetical protein